jgi:phosphoribosylformimino-5-aminoimidazole carboxamide ribotide isomerase
MRIIPAIDILNGKCVRLTQGSFSSVKTYRGKPLDLARSFEDHGFKYLHLVDLDGAREKHIVNYRIIESIASKTALSTDLGGGLKSDNDIRVAFDCGVKQVTIGSIAALDPSLFQEWLLNYGAEKIILGADTDKRKIMVSGWMKSAEIDVLDFIKGWEAKGIEFVASTDISRDGTLKGPSLDLYNEILGVSGVKLIASGGISSVNDLELLEKIGCEGAIIGKAIYEGKINLKELAELC